MEYIDFYAHIVHGTQMITPEFIEQALYAADKQFTNITLRVDRKVLDQFKEEFPKASRSKIFENLMLECIKTNKERVS